MSIVLTHILIAYKPEMQSPGLGPTWSGDGNDLRQVYPPGLTLEYRSKNSLEGRCTNLGKIQKVMIGYDTGETGRWSHTTEIFSIRRKQAVKGS